MSGAPESSIWCGKYCKKQLFTYVGTISILVFARFSIALGTILMTFGGLGPGLNHHDFRWFSGGVPELRQHGRRRVFGIVPGPHSISQTLSRGYSTSKIHHGTCRNEGIRKNRMQITKILKNRGCNMLSLQQRKQDTG